MTTTAQQAEWTISTSVWDQHLVPCPSGGFRLRRDHRRALVVHPLVEQLPAPFRGPLDHDGTEVLYALTTGLQLVTALDIDSGRAVQLGVGRELGGALTLLAAQPVPDDLPRRSLHLDRLADHLARADQPLLEEDRRARVAAVLDELDKPATDHLTRGGLTLGDVYLQMDGGLEVLVGPELSRGARELDLGWILGESLEFDLARGRCEREQVTVHLLTSPLAIGLLEGIREQVDLALVVRVAAARLVLHAHDYWATNHDCLDEVADLVEVAFELLDSVPVNHTDNPTKED